MGIADAPPELNEGGPPPGASWLNQFLAFLKSCRISIDSHSGLTGTISASGTTIGRQDKQEIYIKLTFVGPTASYSWIEQVPAPSGGWVDGFVKGFASTDPAKPSGLAPDPAWEANRNATISTGYITEASRDAAVGRLTFKAGICS